MSIIEPERLEGVERPELVFGWVAPFGTPLSHLSDILVDELKRFDYRADIIRLSDFLAAFNLPTPSPDDGAPQHVRVDTLMTRGNQLRERMGGGEALALLAAAEIANERPDKPRRSLEGRAFILRQLKHPDEVIWLRRIYGPASHLLSVYCPEPVRWHHLTDHQDVPKDEAARLIERDRGEEKELGQHVSRAFHHADFFIDLAEISSDGYTDFRKQIRRYLDLLFGHGILTPSQDEYGIFLAQSAALRSADLSRQVGAAILTERGDVVALGANEVPRFGGGQYWEGEEDNRDFQKGGDANTAIKLESVAEVVEALAGEEWEKLTGEEQRSRIAASRKQLQSTRLMDLTEFGRAVHAEMEAILAAGRNGIPVRGNTLYSTTFPCHNCAKHIIGSGIRRVVYIEPYPKSLADRLHDDAIAFKERGETGNRVVFEPFRGVAPRMYPVLFSITTPEGRRLRRKDPEGNLINEPFGLRSAAYPLNHIEREGVVALHIREFLNALQ